MKTILDITRTELKTLFYSPIAWLILFIFVIQANITFSDVFEWLLKFKEAGRSMSDITTSIFSNQQGDQGVLPKMKSNLYLYVPLLTMGLMSREISSGSIKLLFSSPVSSFQIVLGKYLAMLLYGLVFLVALCVPIIFGAYGIKDLDVPYLLSGLLGIYLLIGAYSSIGLFMSSLTSYQVVAAFSTLALLGALNYVGNIGQDIEFVRELTYWLSMSGRSEAMISGLIISEDLVYFLVIIALFLCFTVVRLEAGRIRNRLQNFGRYFSTVLAGVLLLFIFSRPAFKFYKDVTATERNTLRKSSQNILKNIEGKVTITTYVNLLDYYAFFGVPAQVKKDMKRFEMYTRFKPDLQFKYVYYWDTPTNNPYIYQNYPDNSDEEIAKKVASIYNIGFDKVLNPEQVKNVGLKDEGNVFVRLLQHENGNKIFLRIFKDMEVLPDEKEISAALKCLQTGSIKVGVINTHGEREVFKTGDSDYSTATVLKTNRGSLINNGFTFENVNLSEGEIDPDLDILMIADPRHAINEMEQHKIIRYIDKGGNLFVSTEPRRRENVSFLANKLGLSFREGILVEPDDSFAPDLIVNNLIPGVPEKISFLFEAISEQNAKVTMLEGMGLEYASAGEGDYDVEPLLQTKWRGCWNELESTDFETAPPVLNPDVGEVEQPYEMAIALSKTFGSREDQRIVVLGDADCFSNNEMMMKREALITNNSAFLSGIFEWLSNGQVPVDVRKPPFPDNGFKISFSLFKIWKIVMVWLLPLGIGVTYLFVWFKRRSI
ncbi:MAG: Gldg family protein [Ginsengibacter sp.]